MRTRLSRQVRDGMILLALAAVPARAAGGQQALTEHTITTDSTSPAPRARVADVRWLEGRWRAPALGGLTEETWQRAGPHALVGMFQAVRDDAVMFYEIFTLVEEDGSLVLKLKHFNGDLTGWEEKDAAVQFRLVRVEPDALYLDGLTYRRTGNDALTAFVAVRHRDGSVEELAFPFQRVR